MLAMVTTKAAVLVGAMGKGRPAPRGAAALYYARACASRRLTRHRSRPEVTIAGAGPGRSPAPDRAGFSSLPLAPLYAIPRRYRLFWNLPFVCRATDAFKMIRYKAVMSQHELMEEVLRAAGGLDVATVVPADHTGRIADILFPDFDIVVEVKSLTTDRAASPETSSAIGEMMARNVHLGAPVFWGATSIRLHDLPEKVAANTLRIAGKRVLDEAKAANQQIKATKVALGRPNALGVLALITPPFKLDRQSIGWLIRDAMRDGRCSGIDVLFLVETALRGTADAPHIGNSFLSLHARADRIIPPDLVEAIHGAWGRVTGQLGRKVDQEKFRDLGATS